MIVVMITSLKHKILAKLIEEEYGHVLYARLKIYEKQANNKYKLLYNKPSKSFLIQFLTAAAQRWSGVATSGNPFNVQTQPPITTNVVFDINTTLRPASWLDFLGATAGQDKVGIVVGTSTSPVSANQTALVSPIANGTNLGQLQYGACTISAPQQSGNQVLIAIRRDFTNASGQPININEVGIYAGVTDNNFVPIYIKAILRDVLSTAVSVGVNATQTIEYDIITQA
jgi:hypothetical protein